MTEPPSAGRPTPAGRWDPLWVFGAALALFLTSATEFHPRPTDVAALRVLDGDVPYRDFWTMYAPGSYLTLAAVFAGLGEHLILSNLIGMLLSAGAAAVVCRLVRDAAGRRSALALAALVAIAFYSTNYHRGLTSFPPAFLLIVISVSALAAASDRRGWRWTIGPGLLVGAAALYKHDVAGYAALACGAGLLVARPAATMTARVQAALAFGAAAAALPVLAASVLVALGAGPDLWRDLVVFPLGDFRWVRPQYFPLWPEWRSGSLEMARELRLWAICTLPAVSLATGLVALRGRRTALEPRARFLIGCGLVAFVLHWFAAQVQLNTNAISLAWWGTLVAAVGLARARAGRLMWAGSVVVAGWALAFLSLPIYQHVVIEPPRDTAIDLPRLAGLRAEAGNVATLHDLARALRDAAPPEARLLFVSARNDVVVFARPAPFWLSERRAATRHHEVHPGVTDTEPVQRRMLQALASEPLPVVVRDYRFDDDALESVKARFMERVAVNATLLDEWIAANYEPGPRFGAYEVMRPRTGDDAPRARATLPSSKPGENRSPS